MGRLRVTDRDGVTIMAVSALPGLGVLSQVGPVKQARQAALMLLPPVSHRVACMTDTKLYAEQAGVSATPNTLASRLDGDFEAKY